MTPDTIVAVIDDLGERIMAKRAVINTEFTGHSLRVGMAQDLTAAGFELSGIMQAGRWKSPETPARYSARLSAKSGAVAGYYAE